MRRPPSVPGPVHWTAIRPCRQHAPLIAPGAAQTDPVARQFVLAVGAAKTAMTKTNPFGSAFENLGIGFAGGVLSYLVGLGFEALMSS